MKDVSLRQLRYFQALAQTGHFGRAARECNVTQPALSMQIRQLEDMFGLTLFERLPGRVILTQAGIEVLHRAEKILADVRDLVEIANSLRGTLVGELRVGVIPTVGPYLLPLALPVLGRRFPGLKLRLRETQTATLARELGDGQLDLCIVALPIGIHGLEEIPLFQDRFALALPASHARAGASRADFRMIEQENLLLLEEGHCFRDQALSYCAQANPSMIEGFGATSFATILQMVANGYGVTLIPEMAIESEALSRPGIAVLPFPDPQPRRVIGLLWRETTPRRDDFRTLGAVLTDVAVKAGLIEVSPATGKEPGAREAELVDQP